MNQADDRKTCDLCNRKFASERLEKHVEICKKQKEKKRNVFDSYKQRQIIADANEENTESITKREKQANPSLNKSKAKIVKPVSRHSVNKTIINNQTNGNFMNDKANETLENINEGKKTKEKNKIQRKHEKSTKLIENSKNFNEINPSKDDQQTHKQNENELTDKESTTNSNNSTGTLSTTSTNTSTMTINMATNVVNDKNGDDNEEKKATMVRPKPAQRRIQPPQSRLNKSNSVTNLNKINGQQYDKQTNGQIKNGSKIYGNQNTTNKKPINSIECTICGRTFNRAAGERHIPFCTEKQRQRKNSSNVTNEEALARFRARNAYRSNKGVKKRDKSVPNEKKENFVRQSSLRRALSTIDGLDQVFNNTNKDQINNSSSNLRKRSTSQSNLKNHQTIKKQLQINTTGHSKSSSASSTGHQTYNSSSGYRETAQSRVKARLNQQQKLQKQRMNSNYPKTPIIKFKEKFPNHTNKIEFAGSQQFSQMFKKHLSNSIELNNLPKTVPGVRIGGLSPTKDMTKDIHRNGNHLEDMNDLEQLRARIKEMYLSSNSGSHSQNDFVNLDYLASNEFNNENSFTRENSSKIKSSKSVNDFLSANDEFNDHLINDFDLPKICHQCSTDYITNSARYCYSCGARRLGTVNSFLV